MFIELSIEDSLGNHNNVLVNTEMIRCVFPHKDGISINYWGDELTKIYRAHNEYAVVKLALQNA